MPMASSNQRSSSRLSRFDLGSSMPRDLHFAQQSFGIFVDVSSPLLKGVSRSSRSLTVSGCARTSKLLCDRQNSVGLSDHRGFLQDRGIRTARRTRRRHSLGMRDGVGQRDENCINDRELLGVQNTLPGHAELPARCHFALQAGVIGLEMPPLSSPSRGGADQNLSPRRGSLP